MPMSKKEFEAFESQYAKLKEEHDACALVMATGMPQSTDGERRSTEARYDKLSADVKRVSDILKSAPFKRDRHGDLRNR